MSVGMVLGAACWAELPAVKTAIVPLLKLNTKLVGKDEGQG